MRAERRRGLLDLAVELGENRLQRPDDEGQADEDERDGDAERGEGDLDAERLQERADPAVRRVDRAEGEARHRRRQGEGQVDGRVEQPAAGKLVAGQDPGDDAAEEDVDEGGGERQCRR